MRLVESCLKRLETIETSSNTFFRMAMRVSLLKWTTMDTLLTTVSIDKQNLCRKEATAKMADFARKLPKWQASKCCAKIIFSFGTKLYLNFSKDFA
jgi:hypothetical protein